MLGRLVLVVEEICAVDLQFGHDILSSFESAIFYDTQSVSDRCWPGMWCIDQFYILFWILPESGTAYSLSWRYLHWLDIEISHHVFDTEQLILSKWWERAAGNSWRRVWVSWKYLMGRISHALSFETARCIGIVGQYLHLQRLYHRLRGRHCPSATLFYNCGLAITVVERLQRYNCILLTYIVNVEQNILFYIEVWSCEILSLCGKLIWRWNVVFQLRFVFRRRLYRIPCMNHFVLGR